MYTPTQEDVGYTLKFELSVVDRHHNPVHDGKGGAGAVLYTMRVRGRAGGG